MFQLSDPNCLQFHISKRDSRCKSWKAEYRQSIEEGEVLEDAVGIGVVDDAICCDTLFSSCKCGAHVCFWSYFALRHARGSGKQCILFLKMCPCVNASTECRDEIQTHGALGTW